MNLTPHNILVLTIWPVDDGLIGRYVVPYLVIIKDKLPPGSRLYLVTFENDRERVKSRMSQEKLPDYVSWIPFSYHNFGIRAIIQSVFIFPKLLWLIYTHRINEIHPWCTPPGVLGLLLSRISGKSLVLDSFEPHADPMVESGTWSKDALSYRILSYFEKRMAIYADAIIAANKDMPRYMLNRYGVTRTDMLWKPACVDMAKFSLTRRGNLKVIKELELQDKIVAVYVGKFGGSYLEYEIFELFKAAHNYFGESFRVLLLNGQKDSYIRKLARKADFDSKLIIKRFVHYTKVPDYLGVATFGLVPFKPVPSKKYGSPIKTAEYLAMGIPLIITANISDDSEIVEENNVGVVLNKFEEIDYITCLRGIHQIIKQEDREVRIREVARKNYSYKRAEEVYKSLYRRS